MCKPPHIRYYSNSSYLTCTQLGRQFELQCNEDKKGKGHPCTGRTAHRGIRGIALLYRHWGSVQAVRPIGGLEVYPYSFMTTTLEGGVGSESRPGRSLPPGKTRYPLYRRLGGPQGRSGQVRKMSPPPGFDPRTIEPVASRYTDWGIAAHKLQL
jgi:hypothetical protein